MVLRLNIDRIALDTRDWICKVQIVEIGRPRESHDKKCRFQNLISENEEECHIKAVMYADEIKQYADNLHSWIPISSLPQELKSRQLHTIYWQSFFVIVLKNLQVAVIISVEKLPFVTISSRTHQLMGLFYVEAEMAISNELQEFYVLECSGCKQKKRTKDRKDFECPKCNRKTTLVPRCIFQIDLIDDAATATTSISGELGQKLLSMTVEDIFGITCAKLRKSSWDSSNNTHITLSILSYVEKEQTLPPSTTDRNSKKIRPLRISEVEVMATTTAAGSSSGRPKFEPSMLTKKV
ncbi:hypothetical protein KY289_014168 [Solanum tuberosum]|nr:hypothetical protein KY289_014168 [Solanum tuberosum]